MDEIKKIELDVWQDVIESEKLSLIVKIWPSYPIPLVFMK